MTLLVADTSGLIAALDRTHRLGQAARTELLTAGTIIISPVLLGEFDHVARRVLGRAATESGLKDIQNWISCGRAIVPEVTAEVLATAASVRRQYCDLRLDLVDAVIIAQSADFQSNNILTLDHQDFRAVKPLTEHQQFNILP